MSFLFQAISLMNWFSEVRHAAIGNSNSGTYDSIRNIRPTEQLFSDFNGANFQIKKKSVH